MEPNLSDVTAKNCLKSLSNCLQFPVTYSHTRQRIKYLAQPKYRTDKYSPRPHFKTKKSIEIIRPSTISTRLNQLAIRPVR